MRDKPGSADPQGRRKLLLSGVSFAIALLGAEAATRIATALTRPDSVVPRRIGRPDENLGWSLVPRSRAVSTRTGAPVAYRINSLGLRDDETTYDKPPGLFRIVLLGDSLTFGYGVRIEEHYSRLLEGYLAGVEVINMGVSGFGIDQSLLRLRSEGFRYEPDLVLIYVAHYGDHRHMHTSRFGKAKPRFLLADGELRLTNHPVRLDHGARSRGAVRDVHWWLIDHVEIYRLARTALVRSLGNQGPSRQVVRRRRDARDRDDPDFLRRMHELGGAIVRAMDRECAERGVAFGLVTKVESLHRMALQQGIPVLDVTLPLSNPDLAISEELGHINGPGNGVLAWEIARFARSEGWIPAATAARARSAGVY